MLQREIARVEVTHAELLHAVLDPVSKIGGVQQGLADLLLIKTKHLQSAPLRGFALRLAPHIPLATFQCAWLVQLPIALGFELAVVDLKSQQLNTLALFQKHPEIPDFQTIIHRFRGHCEVFAGGFVLHLDLATGRYEDPQ